MEEELTELISLYASDIVNEQETDGSLENILAFVALLWLIRADGTVEKNKTIAPFEFQANSQMFQDYRLSFEQLLDGYRDRLQFITQELAALIANEYPDLSFYEQQELLRIALENIPQQERYQAERLAKTEIHNIYQLADIDVVSQLLAVYGERLSVKKRWKAWSGACAICKALDGTTVNYDEPFIFEGQSIDLGDGKFYTHNYKEQLTATAHPNDQCIIEWIIESY
ncbi:structural protein [Enterococcus sp. LJL128]